MEITQEQANKFLNWLRESGKTNMFGATPYLQKKFKINRYDAQRFLINWMDMDNFDKDKTQG
tara:strand:+ start:25085 stop:25270 length:186 start_codon:yes stop_codon:yes gene_type:complete